MLALSAFLLALIAAEPALADLRMCNNTGSRVSVALAYTDGQGCERGTEDDLGSRGHAVYCPAISATSPSPR